MQLIKIKKKYQVISALTAVVLVLLGLKLFLSPQKATSPEVSETKPQAETKNVPVNSFIEISFKETIPATNWKIIPFPNFIFETEVIDKTLKITPKESLKTETNYRIEITNPTFPNFYYLLSFTTEKEKYIYSPEKQKQFYQQLDEETHRDMPLFDYTPYRTENFTVGYLKALTLQVLLKRDTPTIRQEVLNWIKSKGVDPASHEIIWKIQK